MSERTEFTISINDKPYVIKDDDQEASALIRLAGRDPKIEDLFKLSASGGEKRLKDEQIVDLRACDKFVTRRLIHYTIDGQSFSTYDDDQSATALMQRASVNPETHDIARVDDVGGYQLFKDDDVIDLQPRDKFVTVRHDGPVA